MARIRNRNPWFSIAGSSCCTDNELISPILTSIFFIKLGLFGITFFHSIVFNTTTFYVIGLMGLHVIFKVYATSYNISQPMAAMPTLDRRLATILPSSSLDSYALVKSWRQHPIILRRWIGKTYDDRYIREYSQ